MSDNIPSHSAGRIDKVEHIISDFTEQISLILQGTIELSGPECDYSIFMWRVCCAIAYDVTYKKKVTRNTQYLIASLIYQSLRCHSQLFSSLQPHYGPLLELVCPIKVRGYTEYPIETRSFPQLNIIRERSFRYQVTDVKQLRIRSRIQLQACQFSDNFRAEARLKGYVPLLPPSTDEWIVYFSELENAIDSTGRYDQIDVSAHIAKGIEALTPSKPNESVSFVKKLKQFMSKSSKNAVVEARALEQSHPSDCLEIISSPKVVNQQVILSRQPKNN